MFSVFLRVFVIYITVLVFLRLMGKRQIGEMQPYEVVITLIIADLATLPMSDTNIPLLHGILPLAILVLIHYIITLLTRKSVKIRQLMSGKPIVVISPEGIEYQALKDLNMNIDDLMEAIRQGNYYSLDQILYAIVETNGKISIIPNSDNAPATSKDVKANNPPAKLPYILISDGKIMKQELNKIGMNKKRLLDILKKLNISNPSQLIILTMSQDGKMYYQEKNKPAKLLENMLKKESK